MVVSFSSVSDLLLFIVFCHSKLDVFGFWIVGQTQNTFEDVALDSAGNCWDGQFHSFLTF